MTPREAVQRTITPVDGSVYVERSRHMIAVAAEALADLPVEPKAGFTRFIRREPLGVVFSVAPWNYPYLTSVNAIVPALMAGNAVVLKHAAQTPLCAERYREAVEAAGFPGGVFQILNLSHEQVADVIADPRTSFVAITGSVAGGRTGIWFMNRCDYLDPALAWTGVGESGRGCSLSTLGYDQLTRPKSFHLRTAL